MEHKNINYTFSISSLAICPYNHSGKGSASEKEGHYLSVADDTGVLRLMLLPKHLHTSTEQAVS